MKMGYRFCVLLVLLVTSWPTAGSATQQVFKSSPTGDLRMYGRVQRQQHIHQQDSTAITENMFHCETPQKAAVIAGKFIADLKLSEGLKWNGSFFTTAENRGFAVAVEGITCRIISADKADALSSFLATQAPAVTVQQAAYPPFMDRFQRYGWGMYGLAGYRNFHQWMDRIEGPKKRRNPMKDFLKLSRNNFRFENWMESAKFDNSDGIMLNTGMLWKIKEADKRNLPYSFRVYCNEGNPQWSARRFPEVMEKPAWFLQSGWQGPEQYWKARPHLSWFATDYQRYQTRKVMERMKRYVDKPLNMGWMHPHGELSHIPWYDIHADYSQAAKTSWRNYLKKNDISLAKAGAMYDSKHPFSSWDQVPIPEFATFAGLNGRVKSLTGTWYCQPAGKMSTDDTIDEPITAKTWKAVTRPGGDSIYEIFPKRDRSKSTWFRREFDFSRKLDGKKLYLYWFPISHPLIHGKNARYHQVYLNGKKAGEIGQWGALDVTKLIKFGSNRIALKLEGSNWDGRIFLSTEAPSVFPNLGEAKNKLWILWKDWLVDSKYDIWVEFLDGMRQVDPERPFKFMAPVKFGTERWLKMASEYGGWPHFTGDGAWFFPWYKRYAFLYGLPASSELAGPSFTLPKMYKGFKFVFLAGLNGHEPVFIAQTYTRNPKLWQWWLDHRKLLSRLGTFDIAGPQVLIYRNDSLGMLYDPMLPYPATGKTTQQQSVFNWDLGRGTLQSLGHSYLYLSDGGLADGKMNNYKLMLDCGNEIMSPEALANIKSWVERGGTFVTLPFTGKSELLKSNTWKIRQLTGCEIRKMRKPGNGSVKILKKQSLLKSLAGKTFPDRGTCLDWTGVNYDMLGVELAPGDNCEVIAKFENGSPAIVRRKLGKGQVIVLGTTFWRNAQDIGGVWYSQPLEREFLTDLFDGVGFAQATCPSSDPLVWTQPYRSVNGLDSVVVAVNMHNDKATSTTIDLQLKHKPSAIVCYGVDGLTKLPFEWQNGVAKVTLSLPANEVKVICAEDYKSGDAVAHWWQYQLQHWRELTKPRLDFSAYTTGKWADPTVDLRFDACFTQKKPAKNWTSADFKDSSWTKAPLDIISHWGADPKKTAWLRKNFTIPAQWQKRGGKTYLVYGEWTRNKISLTPFRVYLNGTMLSDFHNTRYACIDVTKLLNDDGNNVVAYEVKPGDFAIGFLGNTWLYHRDAPAKTIDLSGNWQVEKGGKVIKATVPGRFHGVHPTTQLFIPKEWQGRYNIRLYMDGKDSSTLGCWVNDRLVMRFHHNFGKVCDIDITSQLKFGENNTFTLAGPHEYRGKNRHEQNWDLKAVRLELYPRGQD